MELNTPAAGTGPSTSSSMPVDVHLMPGCRHGYVWDAEGAISLRKEHHLLGSFCGGVASYKSQNAVGGPPMEMQPDQVALAARHGWVRVLAPVLADQAAQLAPGPDATRTPAVPPKPGNKRGAQDAARAPLPAWLQAYYAHYADAYTAQGGEHDEPSQRNQQLPAKAQQPQPHALCAGAKRPHLAGMPWLRQYYSVCEAAGLYTSRAGLLTAPAPSAHSTLAAPSTSSAPQAPPAQDNPPPVWKAALQEGAAYVIPLRAGDPSNASGASRTGDLVYPSSDVERIRLAVVTDLHAQGYALSAGSKFGCDLLAYPGDPSLYHAQFTVRLLRPSDALNPLALKGFARGSHGARKHMLLATLDGASSPGSTEPPLYVTIAPEAGFGKAAG